MELGQPEALRVLDQHQGRVRNVPRQASITVVLMSALVSPRRNRSHDRLLFRRGNPAVQLATKRLPSRSCHCSNSAAAAAWASSFSRSRRSADKTTHTPVGHTSSSRRMKMSTSGEFSSLADRRDDFAAVIDVSSMPRHIEIAVDGHGQRAWNRRRQRHDKHIRRKLTPRSRARCETPNLCCSSMTASPKVLERNPFAKATRACRR